MKINWITAAFITFGVFASFMIFMIILSTRQNHELVTKNYYEKELQINQQISNEKNADLLKEKVSINLQHQNITINFPNEIKSAISGSIYFYRPSSQKEDQTFNIKTTNHQQTIPISKLKKGLYQVKINWHANHNTYFFSKAIIIP